MRFLVITSAVLLMSLTLGTGCAPDRPKGVVYEPRIEMQDLVVGLPLPNNEFKLLVDERTEGRFACPVAVAKFVSPPPESESAEGELVFQLMRHREQAYWAEQMRGMDAIQYMLFISPRSTAPEGQGIEALCRTASDLGAPLLIVYTPNGYGPNSGQVLGAMYNTKECKPLATLHASDRILDEDGAEVSPFDERGDHRDTDARYQAQRAFEKHAMACLRELTHRDTRPSTIEPHNWHQPYIERWWIRDW